MKRVKLVSTLINGDTVIPRGFCGTVVRSYTLGKVPMLEVEGKGVKIISPAFAWRFPRALSAG